MFWGEEELINAISLGEKPLAHVPIWMAGLYAEPVPQTFMFNLLAAIFKFVAIGISISGNSYFYFLFFIIYLLFYFLFFIFYFLFFKFLYFSWNAWWCYFPIVLRRFHFRFYFYFLFYLFIFIFF